jgi:hypothetical protein
MNLHIKACYSNIIIAIKCIYRYVQRFEPYLEATLKGLGLQQTISK